MDQDRSLIEPGDHPDPTLDLMNEGQIRLGRVLQRALQPGEANAPNRKGARAALEFRAALGGMVRLAAGIPRDPYDPLSIGTTAGQTDLAVGLVADWGSGSVGARFTAGYTMQLAATVEHRATSPVTPLDLSAPIVTADWNPGDVIHLGVRPFFRIAEAFAVQLGIAYYRHGRDSYESTSPGVDPSIMEEGTKRDAWVFGGGMTYSSPSAADPRAKGLPVEAYWTYEGVVASSKGVVPKVRGVRFGLRLYFGLWSE